MCTLDQLDLDKEIARLKGGTGIRFVDEIRSLSMKKQPSTYVNGLG